MHVRRDIQTNVRLNSADFFKAFYPLLPKISVESKPFAFCLDMIVITLFARRFREAVDFKIIHVVNAAKLCHFIAQIRYVSLVCRAYIFAFCIDVIAYFFE